MDPGVSRAMNCLRSSMVVPARDGLVVASRDHHELGRTPRPIVEIHVFLDGVGTHHACLVHRDDRIVALFRTTTPLPTRWADARSDAAMARLLRLGFTLGPEVDKPEKQARPTSPTGP